MLSNEVDEFIKENTTTFPSFLLAKNASRKEPGRIVGILYVQRRYIDESPVLCYAVKYLQGEEEYVQVDPDQQQIIDHHRENYFCLSCRKDTLASPAYDQYKVTDELWSECGSGHHMLCIECFADWFLTFKKRPITQSDFVENDLLNVNNRFIKNCIT